MSSDDFRYSDGLSPFSFIRRKHAREINDQSEREQHIDTSVEIQWGVSLVRRERLVRFRSEMHICRSRRFEPFDWFRERRIDQREFLRYFQIEALRQ